MRTILIVAALVASAAAYAWAQTPQGIGAPIWAMGYRTDLGVWQGLKLDTSANLLATALPTSGVPTVAAVTTVATSAGQVIAATTGNRAYFRIANGNLASGGTIYCTDDGSTPSASNFSFPVYAGGYTDSSGWAFVPNTAITCVAPGGTAAIKAESYP